jgi:hypothetical protein
MQERRIFNPDVAAFILNAETGKIEHIIEVESKVFFEFH